MAQAINLQITPSNVMPKIYASQFDIGREIEISLYDGASAYTPPVGTDIRFEGKKPDGNGFSYACTYTGNVVTVVTTDQMTVLAGEIPCELRMSLNGDDIGTLNIIFVIEKSPIDENVPISDTEIPAIIDLARDEQYTAEAWAIGERNGVPVGPEDPAYHNNAKYWAEHAEYGALDDLADVEITTPTNGQVVTYNGTSKKWENKDIPSDTVTQAILAPVEGDTSLHAYEVGKQLIYNDTLYKVIAPISVNDALVVGTNIEVSPKTVIEQVEDNASEIDDVWATMAQNGAHNLLPVTGRTQTYTSNNKTLSVVVNEDKSFTVSGETGADTFISVCNLVTYKNGTYVLSGYKSGTGAGTSKLYIADKSSGTVVANDTGDGAIVALDGTYEVVLLFRNGTNISTPVTYYPMIRLASDPNTDYAPYAPTNRDCMSYAVNTKLGAHNLLPYPYTDGASRVNNGVTYAVDSKGIIVANSSQATTSSSYYTMVDNALISNTALEPNKSYILSGGISDNKKIGIRFLDSGGNIIGDTLYEEGTGLSFTVPANANKVYIFIVILAQPQITNATFYPMIRLASDTDTTYAPYAMTNRELTEVKKYRYQTANADANVTFLECNVLRSGRVVYITGSWQGNNTNAESILTLPSELRPSDTVRGTGGLYVPSHPTITSQLGVYNLATDGKITQAMDTRKGMMGNFVFIYNL